MTDPSDPTGPAPGHLGLDTLADLAEGLLDADRADAARAHLAGCPRCQADAAALDAVSADLAALGAVAGRLPAEAANRLDAALAAEPGAEPGRAPASAVTVVPSLDERRAVKTRRGTQLLQVAAVLVVLLGLSGVGYTLATAGGDSGSGGSTAASGDSAADDAAGGSGESAASAVVSSGTDYRQDTLGQALRAVTGRTARAGAAAPGLQSQTSSAAPSSPSDSSGPSPQGALSASPKADAGGAAALADPGALGACLDRLGLVGAPLGVDLASYQGQPAAVVVLPSEGDPTHVDVYAIAPTCPAGDFLAFARVARP